MPKTQRLAAVACFPVTCEASTRRGRGIEEIRRPLERKGSGWRGGGRYPSPVPRSLFARIPLPFPLLPPATQASFPALGTGYMFSRFASITCFPALGTGYMFSRAWRRLHVFPRLAPVTYFPALSISHMFSRAWHRLHIFPRLAPPNSTRAWHRLRVFLRLASVTCFSAFGIGYMIID